jgi:hypothetical protein
LNTAEALEAITDRGEFELLVTSILRRADSKYAAIIHTGINPRGETIRSPVDGFCLVPGSEPDHFLFIQHTTTERSALRKKWLNNNGDLIKANSKAQEIRKNNPEAEFTVILVTNHYLTMADNIINDTYQKAKELNLKCDIWEQSRLTDFLDNEPEGHWLRRKYLGIEAEFLSESLLHYLCNESLTRYKNEIQLSDPITWITRGINKFIKSGFLKNKYTFQALVGDSGYGKSIAAYSAFKEHIESNGHGLWIPAEFINNCISIESAIDKVLNELYPQLEVGSGKLARKFISEDSKFILVVDDVNRTAEPNKIITKLLNWSRPNRSDTTETTNNPSSDYLIICPLWPQIWDYNQNKSSWIQTVSIGPMNPDEGLLAVELVTKEAGIYLSNIEKEAIANKLGNDPFLIGLFSQLIIGASTSINLINLAEDAMERFIDQCAKEVVDSNRSYLKNEYLNALSKVCMYMLREKRLNPFWEDILNWFENDQKTLKVLRELVRNEKLIKLADQENKLVFRHDRIREAFFIKSMISILNDPFSDKDILKEPFYAEIIGKAIILSPQKDLIIKNLADEHPLALFEALKNFGNPLTTYHKMIVDSIKDWVNRKIATRDVLESVINSICFCLMNTDSSAVLKLTENFPAYPPILLSRLRNGSALSGSIYCSRDSITMGDDLRDQIIEHGKKRHGVHLLDELRVILSSAACIDEVRKGALALAGFLEFSELEKEIEECWNLANNKQLIIAEAIWAGSKCCNERPDKLLGPMMKFLAGLSDERISNVEESPRIRVSEDLGVAMQRGICNRNINYFTSLHRACKSLNWPIVIMLEHVDAPEAIELCVRFAAKESRSFFASYMLSDNWDPAHPHGKRLSNPSLDRLKILWSSLRTDKQTQYQAFRIWKNSAQYEQIDILNEVPPDSLLYRMAVRKRAQLGDMSVVQQLVSLLSKNIHMFDVAPNVWCEEVSAVTERYLESIKDNIPGAPYYSDNVISYLSELLTSIPVNDSEALLEKYWEHLRCIPKFIQVALYIGTEKCLRLADSSIRDCPRGIPIFKMLTSTFGFFETGRQDYLIKKHLDRLAPYIDKFDDDILWHLAELSQRLRIPEWRREEISSRLSEEWRIQFYPNDNDLLRELDEVAASSKTDSGLLIWHFTHWIEKFEKRNDTRAQMIVERWFNQNHTLQSLQVVVAFLKVKGTRSDLAFLDRYEIAGPRDEISRIKDDVHFSVCRRSLE